MPARPTNEPGNYFAIGKQSAKGTEASTFYFTKHLSGTALEREDEIQSEREGGDGQQVGLRYRSAVSLDGQSVQNARPEVAARLLAYALQSDSVATGSSAGDTQLHTAVPTAAGPSNPYYLTIEQRFGDEIERVSDAKVTSLTIEGEQGRPIKLTAAFVGGGTPYYRDTASTLTATRETVQPFFFPNGSYVIDGTANTRLTKFTSTINRGVDSDIRTTSLHRADVVDLTLDTDLEGTLLYEDNTLYRKIQALGGSQVPLSALGLATGTFQAYSDFGSGTTARTFKLTQHFQYTAARVNKLEPDGQTVYLDFTAMGIKGATTQLFTEIQTASGGAF